MTLNRLTWIIYQTTFGELWQPVKPKYGNYRGRGYTSRFRKMLKAKP